MKTRNLSALRNALLGESLVGLTAIGGAAAAGPILAAGGCAPALAPTRVSLNVATRTGHIDQTKPTGPLPIHTWAGFQTPESVLWDELNDRYLVSNINGGATDLDDNGYISVVAPDGKVTTEKWIAGGRNGAHLDAPKGTAIANGALYVADITVVRIFDLASGAPRGEVIVPGAIFLNDVASGPDGTVYISDTGMKLGEPVGAVYAIDKDGKLKTVAQSKDLGAPNGLGVHGKSLLVVSFNSSELYRLDEKGQKQDVTRLPKGSLDGIVQLGADDLLISSWEGSAVYKGKLNGSFEAVLENQVSPADIGWDKKRSRLLVPHLLQNTVEAYEIK